MIILKHIDKGFFLSLSDRGFICRWTDNKDKAKKFPSEEAAENYNFNKLYNECIPIKL